MSGGLSLGQPVVSDGGGSSRLWGIMVLLFFLLGTGGYVVFSIIPDSESAQAEREQQRLRATERSVTLAEQGVAFVSCVEVTCEEARAQFFEMVGEEHPYEFVKTVMDGTGQLIGYIYLDRRLQLVIMTEKK